MVTSGFSNQKVLPNGTEECRSWNTAPVVAVSFGTRSVEAGSFAGTSVATAAMASRCRGIS